MVTLEITGLQETPPEKGRVRGAVWLLAAPCLSALLSIVNLSQQNGLWGWRCTHKYLSFFFFFLNANSTGSYQGQFRTVVYALLDIHSSAREPSWLSWERWLRLMVGPAASLPVWPWANYLTSPGCFFTSKEELIQVLRRRAVAKIKGDAAQRHRE